MSKGWTPERRAKQAAAIRRWKPWLQNPGVKTAAGKAISRFNARETLIEAPRRDRARSRAGRPRAGEAAMKRLWNQAGVPRKGWTCVAEEDIREDGTPPEETQYATCEMCGCKKVRFVHRMEHHDFERALSVGRVCAAKMSRPYVAEGGEANTSVAAPHEVSAPESSW